MSAAPEFDRFADAYETDLNRALAASGEDQEYFAHGRIAFLARCLRKLDESPRSAMDYGCGIGGTAPLLRELVGASHVVGVDLSERSLERARGLYGCDGINFQTFNQLAPAAQMDLVYCNGVFHHIPEGERPSAMEYIYRSLRPGGLFAFWENNPWNPGTRYIMAKCVFDRDAVTLSPPRAKRLLRRAGFAIVRTDFLFYFPRTLKALRALEPGLRHLPLGAQFQVLGRRPTL